jgi:hypothetical protein
MESFSDCRSGWSKEPQWKNDSVFFTMFSTSESKVTLLSRNVTLKLNQSRCFNIHKLSSKTETLDSVQLNFPINFLNPKTLFTSPKALHLFFPIRIPMEWLPNIEAFFSHLISKALNKKLTLALN